MDNEIECEFCEGTGEIYTRAYQSGGEIVDETWEKCICQKKEDDREEDR